MAQLCLRHRLPRSDTPTSPIVWLLVFLFFNGLRLGVNKSTRGGHEGRGAEPVAVAVVAFCVMWQFRKRTSLCCWFSFDFISLTSCLGERERDWAYKLRSINCNYIKQPGYMSLKRVEIPPKTEHQATRLMAWIAFLLLSSKQVNLFDRALASGFGCVMHRRHHHATRSSHLHITIFGFLDRQKIRRKAAFNSFRDLQVIGPSMKLTVALAVLFGEEKNLWNSTNLLRDVWCIEAK